METVAGEREKEEGGAASRVKRVKINEVKAEWMLNHFKCHVKATRLRADQETSMKEREGERESEREIER
jgi:hypothetical protein